MQAPAEGAPVRVDALRVGERLLGEQVYVGAYEHVVTASAVEKWLQPPLCDLEFLIVNDYTLVDTP